MNREQKAAAIAEIAENIQGSDAVFAVDFRGISVPQAADVRNRLRDADASFRVVKNTLTERAADQVGADALKQFLEGPTALTFVRGDAATAAKAIAGFTRETQLLAFKGGVMDGDVLDAEQIVAISRLPSRDVLYGQLVGVVASPITGVVRTLNALISGVAIALNGVREKKESGEIPAGEPPAASAAEAAAATAAEPAPAEEQRAAEAETATEPVAADEQPAADAAPAETPAEGEGGAAAETPDQDAEPPSEPASTEEPAEGAPDTSTSDETTDQADASA
ncbi:MAG: large subunit ribosomal protein [Solirubrobacteraceae bacterium]|jgi:large subunit ribosomal protein L10|nr:large subunit ribosomal protein [Solirubrobacteraceae bacterium]